PRPPALPTRRSSDLLWHIEALDLHKAESGLFISSRIELIHCIMEKLDDCLIGNTLLAMEVVIAVTRMYIVFSHQGDFPFIPLFGDRKRTRLTSSHGA